MYSFICGCYLTIFFPFFFLIKESLLLLEHHHRPGLLAVPCTPPGQHHSVCPENSRYWLQVMIRPHKTKYLDSHPRSPLWNLLIPLNVFYFISKKIRGEKGAQFDLRSNKMRFSEGIYNGKKNTKKLRGSPRARWKWQMNDFNGTLLLTRFASWWLNPAIVQFISVLLCDRWFSFHDLL